MYKLKVPELPKEIITILKQYNSPERLIRHLRIVSLVASKLMETAKYSVLSLNEALIRFGASTHDIGKAIETNELFESGKKHEREVAQKLDSILERIGLDAQQRLNWQNDL